MTDPSQRRPARASSRRAAETAAPVARPARALPPLSDGELDELQALLDSVPAPLEPLDVSMLDGFLCGVLLQPRRVAATHWLRYVTDVEGGAVPQAFDATRLHALAQRRHAELDGAIQRRQWFDPWVFELADDDVDAQPDELEPAAIDAVYAWVAGFATALALFPDLMAMDAKALTEPLALVYRHLAADDLEDADDLLAEIDSLEPAADLTEAVEGLVRACLLLADIARPLAAPRQGVRGAGGPKRWR